MKKTTLALILLLILLVLLILGYKLNERYNTIYGAWDINWGFQVPKPENTKVVFENFGGFPMDGEAYIIVDYNAQKFIKINTKEFWITINKDNNHTIEEKILNFQNTVIELYDENKKEDYIKLFQENPIKFKNGDKYFLKQKVDGSYFIAILNLEKHRIFTMEWVQ